MREYILILRGCIDFESYIEEDIYPILYGDGEGLYSTGNDEWEPDYFIVLS
jgi:hypothetical protein